MKLFGIDVGVHWSWWALTVFFMAGDLLTGAWLSALYSASMLTMLMVIIIGHELAHALTARRFGYETYSITMHLLGGVAMINMAGIKPREQFWVAFAGPASNLIAFLIVVILLAINPLGILTVSAPLGSLLYLFGVYNLFIGVFNLLPAWPMDGGRILRALMSGYDNKTTMNVSHGASLVCSTLFFALALTIGAPLLFLIATALLGVVWYERSKGHMING